MDDSNFIQNSLLDILIPQDSEYDIENMIKPADVNEHTELNNTRFFPFIARRNVLHFGKFDSGIFVVH